jgi:hypothetical protein
MSATTNRFELLTLERLREIYDIIISTPPGSAAWGSIGAGTGVGSQTDLVTYLNGNYVPLTRTLTINGVTYDLSANRSWTIATGGDSISPFLLMGG